MAASLDLNHYDRPKLTLPTEGGRCLLHACCAPCTGEVMLALKASGIDYEIFFYNPNIHPHREYVLRKEDNKRYADKLGVPFIDADYDKDRWMERTRGLEHEPERGLRCTVCFDMRFEVSARYAHDNDFSVWTSSLSISRWKDFDQINACGHRASKPYKDLVFWDFNWRKKGGSQRMLQLSKQEHFYKQEYCGCHYSLRDTNAWRQKNDKPRIAMGEEFYGIPVTTENKSS